MMRWPTSGAAGVVPTSTVSRDGSNSKLLGLPPRGNQTPRCLPGDPCVAQEARVFEVAKAGARRSREGSEKSARRFGGPESYPQQMLDRAGAYYGLCS